MVFTHANIITPYDINTIEGDFGRRYVTPNGSYPSITTVLGDKEKPWLIDWRESMGEEAADAEMARAAARGTAVHLMAEHYLQNKPNVCDGHLKEHADDFRKMRLMLNKISNIHAQEAALWSDTLRLAGRVDCIAEFDGVLSVVDFKTSTNNKVSKQIEDYYLQTTAYALMFQEMYDIQIDHYAIIMSVERGAVPLVFTGEIEPHICPLLERINTYHKQHPL